MILDAESYKQKANEVLSDTATCEKLRSCPRPNTNKVFRKSIRDLAANCMDPALFKRLFSDICSLAYFNGRYLLRALVDML